MPSMTAVWLLPVVPACVAGNTAGVVAREVQDEALGMSIALIGECAGQHLFLVVRLAGITSRCQVQCSLWLSLSCCMFLSVECRQPR